MTASRFSFSTVSILLITRMTGACGAELAEQLFLLRADVRDGLDEQQRGIHIGDGVVHDIVHIVAEARARLMEARRVYEHELRVIVRDDAADAVARRLRLVGNNSDLFRQRGG